VKLRAITVFIFEKNNDKSKILNPEFRFKAFNYPHDSTVRVFLNEKIKK